MTKHKSVYVEWIGVRFRFKIDAKIIFPFRLDIPNTQEYNNCRAVIGVKDITWMPRPVNLRTVQYVLVNMSRRSTYKNCITHKADAPYFVHHQGQESDFYFKYNWDRRVYELISITPTQDLFNDNGEPAIVYRLGLDR